MAAAVPATTTRTKSSSLCGGLRRRHGGRADRRAWMRTHTLLRLRRRLSRAKRGGSERENACFVSEIEHRRHGEKHRGGGGDERSGDEMDKRRATDASAGSPDYRYWWEGHAVAQTCAHDLGSGVSALQRAASQIAVVAGSLFLGAILSPRGASASTSCERPLISSSPNELASLSFINTSRGDGSGDISASRRFMPPSGAKFVFPDGTWTNQDYKATVRPRLEDGTTYTEMTPMGRAREPQTDEDHVQHPAYWGISQEKRLDELGANKTMLERRRTDQANVNGLAGGKTYDRRNWFLLDEEGRKWDMRIVNPRLANPRSILDMSYSDFWGLLQEGHIERVKYTASRNRLWVWTKPDAPRGVTLNLIGLPYDPTLYEELIKNDVKVDVAVRSPLFTLATIAVGFGYPLLASYILYRILIVCGEDEWKPYGEQEYDDDIWRGSKLRMKDIGGLEDISTEIDEVVDYLRFPNRYSELGAEPPSGVLLTGPPGCGKTLLAQCIAGEARAPLIGLASTTFQGMHQGSGPAMIRHTFQMARRIAPCVIFIDEIDGVGSRRSDAFDERTQTINQMLTELDGFERNHGVVLLAATNRPAAMDEALTRPGRIDKVIAMPPPKLAGRVDILKIHGNGKRLAKDFDFELVARATSGFTGAELRRLMDDTANEVIKRMRHTIETEDCLREVAKTEEVTAWQSVTPGYFASYSPAAKIRVMSDIFKKSCAVYEAGKVLITFMLEDFDDVNKTILFPQGQGVTKTFFLPQQQYMDTGTYTRRYVENLLIMHMSGLAAQELVLGRHNLVENPTLRDDLKAANVIARQMVLRMGFNKRVGPVSMMTAKESLRGKELSMESLDVAIADMSPEMGELVSSEIRQLIDAAQAKAYYGIIKNYTAMCRLAKALLVKRKMSGTAMKEILDECNLFTFADDEAAKGVDGGVDGFGFFDDNRLKVPLGDPALQRVIDGVVRGRRLGVLEDPATMMADVTQVDATKDLTTWLLAGGRKIDLVDMAKPIDPWVDTPVGTSTLPLSNLVPEAVRVALGYGPSPTTVPAGAGVAAVTADADGDLKTMMTDDEDD